MAFIKVKIAKKKIPKKKVINLVINITNITNRIGVEWFSMELKKIYNAYRQSSTVKKTELKDMLKNMANMQTEKKVEYFDTMPDDISEDVFVKYLRVQTLGADFVNYDYLIRYYGIVLDDNLMPIFTEEFPFDNKIKKEALFVWNIRRSIKMDKHLRNFNQDYFEIKLQSKIESDDISELKKMSFDMHFNLLDIIIEIDENHTNVKENDDIKNSIMQQNGILYKRMDFQKIYTGDIKKDANVNVEILNNTYYTEFIKDLIHVLTYKLLKKNKKVREYFVMHYFKDSLIDKCSELSPIIRNDIDNKALLENELVLCDVDDRENYLVEIKNNDYNIKKNTKLWNLYISYIDNLLDSSNFISMFNFKDRCKKNIDMKIISFEEIIILLDVMPSNNIPFKKFLLDIGIITKFNVIDEDITLNWSELSLLILKYECKDDLKALLQLYFIGVEKSYEKILNIFESFDIPSEDMQKSYILCVKNITKKVTNDVKNNLLVVAISNIKLDFENQLKKANKETIYYKNLYNKSLVLEGLRQSSADTVFNMRDIPQTIPEAEFAIILNDTTELINSLNISTTNNNVITIDDSESESDDE